MNHFSIDHGTQPGNETRIRNLESTAQALSRQVSTMLEMLRANQRYGGGGGGANIIVARVQEPVGETDDTFTATVAEVVLGTAPAIDTEITVKNLNSGLINEAFVGNITGAYRAAGTEGEEVFVLLKGMTIYCIKDSEDGWRVWQSGGALSNSEGGGGGGGPVSPFVFIAGLGV
jgi:hypothetical protein